MKTKEINNFKEDLFIKNILVEKGFINNNRVKLCGRWFNNKLINAKKITNIPSQYRCMSWECRACRRKLIDKQIHNHYLNNSKFIKRGGLIMHFALSLKYIENRTNTDFFNNFKKSLALLKESRGWKKIKNISNGIFHYDNIEITYSENDYIIKNNISYGALNLITPLQEIEELLTYHWIKNTKKFGYVSLTSKLVEISISRELSKGSMTDFNNPSIMFGDRDIKMKSNSKGTLEHLEQEFKDIYLKPTTKLKSLEYLKHKNLLIIGNAIENINTMLRKTKRGRIWFMSIKNKL